MGKIGVEAEREEIGRQRGAELLFTPRARMDEAELPGMEHLAVGRRGPP